MIISLSSPRFDPLASKFLHVASFDIGNERIHKTSAALAGTIELQDTGIRMQASISIIVMNADLHLYSELQYIVSNHPDMHMSHKDGMFIIAPSSAKISGNTILLNALVVGNV